MSESAYVVRAFYARPIMSTAKTDCCGASRDATYFASLDIYDLEELLKQQDGRDAE